MATGQQKLTTYLPPVEAEQLRALAERDGRTVTGLLRLLIRRHLAVEAEPIMQNDELMLAVARHLDDDTFADLYSPEGFARQRTWTTEDDWIVSYTTSRIRRGTLDGAFAVFVYKPKGRGRQRVWERVQTDTTDTRKEAKQRALAYYYEHSPKRAEKHRWNGTGYDRD